MCIYLWACWPCTYLWRNVSSSIFPNFKSNFLLSLLSWRSLLHVLRIYVWLANIFLICGLPFHSVDSVPWFFFLMKVVCAFGVLSKKMIDRPRIRKLSSCFFLRVLFIVFALMFRFLICFESVFVYGERYRSNLIYLHLNIQFLQHHFLKRLSFPHWMVLPFL